MTGLSFENDYLVWNALSIGSNILIQLYHAGVHGRSL